MKKLFSLLLSVSLLVAQCAFAENTAEAFSTGDYEYVLLENDTATITRYIGSDSEITIPDKLDGHVVSGIGEAAFAGAGITEITIPDSVTSIGIAAFNHCDSLTEVVIPDGVTMIDIATFADCAALEKITLPESVTSIGDSAFASCFKLTEIEIPDSVTYIGVYAFPSTALTEIVIPDSVTAIGEGAFGWCFDLRTVTLPASVPDLDLSNVFKEVLEGIKFIVPTGSNSERLCKDAGVRYTYLDADSE